MTFDHAEAPMRACVKCGLPAFDSFGDDLVCSDHMLEEVLAEIERERKNPARMRSRLVHLYGVLGLLVRQMMRRIRLPEKRIEEMSLGDLESYLIEHAKDLGIVAVGRDARGAMKFRFAEKK